MNAFDDEVVDAFDVEADDCTVAIFSEREISNSRGLLFAGVATSALLFECLIFFKFDSFQKFFPLLIIQYYFLFFEKLFSR